MNRLPSPPWNSATPDATKASSATTWITVISSPPVNGLHMRWLANTPSRVERRNQALSDAPKQLSIYTVGGWVWI